MGKTQEAIKYLNYVIWFIGVISIAVMFRLHIRSVALREGATIVAVFYILMNMERYFKENKEEVETD